MLPMAGSGPQRHTAISLNWPLSGGKPTLRGHVQNDVDDPQRIPPCSSGPLRAADDART